MSSLISLRKQGLAIFDALIWYTYLLLLVAVSFVNDYYSSQAWLLLSGCLYVLSALCALSAINGGRCNWYGLMSAKYAVMVLLAMLTLLLLQMTISLGQHTEFLLLDNSLFDGEVPEWFQPHERWSVVPEKTRWLFNSELLIFAMFVLSIALVCSRRRLKQFLAVLLIVGLFHSLIGISAKYLAMHLIDVKQLDGHFGAARAWFVNRNHFASFISLCLLGALAFQFKVFMSQSQLRFRSMLVDQLLSYRAVYALGLTVGIIAIVLSQSRAGFLAFILSLFIVLIGFGRDSIRAIGFSRRKLVLPMLIVVTVVVAYFGTDLLTRFSSNSLLGERVAQWRLTWEAIKPAWLFGYGGNSYADVFQIFRGYQDFRQVVFNQSHNDYLHIWLEQGLLGLALWLGFLMLLIRMACINIVNTSSNLVRATLISVVVVSLAALAQSSVDFNLQILNIRYYFFAIMSLVFSVPAIRQRKGAPNNSVLV